jgi:hypothetical protein
MAAAAAAPAQVFATRKQIDDLTDEYRRMTEGLTDPGMTFTQIIDSQLDDIGERATPRLKQYVNWYERIEKDIYLSARKWFEIVGASSVFEREGPPSGAPGAAYHPTNIPLETYEKWDKHSLKLVKLDNDCHRVIRDIMDDLKYGLRLAPPGISPPGAEGHGMPQHMQRGDMWHAGMNRRR